MKHDIIKTDDYLLVVDESEIKGYYHDAHINKVKHSGGAEYAENSITKNIISHLPLNGSPILEGVDLLPRLEEDDSIGWPLIHYINEKHNQDRVMGFCDGYKKAKEKYKYTDEDIIKLADMHREDGYPPITFEWLIQSLPQPNMPIGFEQEMNETFEDAFTYDRVRRFYGKEPKTTTTPEGHTQWVGTYVFN